MQKSCVKDVVSGLDYYELLKLKQDLQSGGLHFKKLVEDSIKSKELKAEAICPVCTTDICADGKSTFTLTFGPEDFKKKASFCGVDCLEYFVKDVLKR